MSSLHPFMPTSAAPQDGSVRPRGAPELAHMQFYSLAKITFCFLFLKIKCLICHQHESEILPFPNPERNFVLPEEIIQEVREGETQARSALGARKAGCGVRVKVMSLGEELG